MRRCQFALALLVVFSLSSGTLLAQAPKGTPPCTLFFGSAIDPEVVIATCTQLIESGRLSGRALAAAYLTRIVARSMGGRAINHSQTIAEATAAIENDPQGRLAYMIRLDSYLQTGDYDRALQDATKYIELDPTDWNALNLRSSVYAAKGDYERALADDSKGVAMAPKNPLAFANRASTYRKAGKTAEAIGDYRNALRLEPNNVEYRKALERLGAAP
jgi:tetratricopeptide (TPR) repeat protein